MSRRDWDLAIVSELRRLNRLIRQHSSDEGNNSLEHLREPIVLLPAEEQIEVQPSTEGALSVRGTTRDQTVAFFDSSWNRYVPAQVTLKTWYRGTVTAER